MYRFSISLKDLSKVKDTFLKVIWVNSKMDKLKEKYINEHSRFMDIDGLQVHYRDQGKGFPLLLLHGAFSSLHTFNGWARELARNYRVIRLDLPGFGLTGHINDAEYTRHIYMTCIKTLLDKLGVDQCNIAGSSLGGWMAWEFALEYPKRINKMVLIDAAGYIKRRDYPLPFKMAQIPFLNRIMENVTPRGIVARFVKEVYGDEQKVTDELIDRYQDLFLINGNRKAFIAIANTKFERNEDKIKEIKTPTLILWGTEDKWIPIEHAYRFKDELPNARLIVYEGVGHIPMEEIPKQSAKDVRAFLLKK